MVIGLTEDMTTNPNVFFEPGLNRVEKYIIQGVHMQMFCANPDWMNEILINDERLDDANELYRLMYLIRQVQRKIESVYHLDEMKTPVHLCIGQEAIAAGVCHALSSSDYVFSKRHYACRIYTSIRRH